MRRYWFWGNALTGCLGVLMLSACGYAQTQNKRPATAGVKVRPDSCRRLTDTQRAWLGPEWQPFEAYAKSCEVKRSGSTALYLVSVWADDYEARLPAGAPAVKLPKPVLVSKDGTILGRLPVGFPRDPPRSTDVTFTKWAGDFPAQIRVDVEDPTVVGNHSLTVRWEPASKQFVELKTNP